MRTSRAFGVLLGVVLCAFTGFAAADQEKAADSAAAIQGTWEGPWYRGMTSGRVKVQIEGSGGTIQFTNLDNFGGDVHPITQTRFDGHAFSFRSEGDKSGPLTATLKLNEAGTQMKGLGSFDGFPLRFEIKRAP